MAIGLTCSCFYQDLTADDVNEVQLIDPPKDIGQPGLSLKRQRTTTIDSGTSSRVDSGLGEGSEEGCNREGNDETIVSSSERALKKLRIDENVQVREHIEISRNGKVLTYYHYKLVPPSLIFTSSPNIHRG